MDLVIALDSENVLRSMGALARLGYRPRVPVSLSDFADSELRAQWKDEKGMVVFQLFSDEHIETPVDVFITMPFDFKLQWSQATRLPVVGGLVAPVVALAELLAMKSAVARDQALLDIAKLRKLHDQR